MIKPLTRDILITVSIKFSLLILLWFLCFKNVEKSHQTNEQWLLGAIQKEEYLFPKENGTKEIHSIY
ncbi:Uncharacterised protein [Legionella wadsworthii]|uniref:Uncharacterized protein n=1 Tax=Legionella wadsworthii TaxID=28088 RepID=A0A378LSX0_9GAMM|nr:cytochrome oxidase putative small subunit CydP [Legionella wadsworthii]STY30166.1 Uncharacterised protein [Legionella wadsworthii]